MTNLEQLIRDLDTLRQSIKLNSADLHQLPPAQLKTVLEHAAWCMTEFESHAKAEPVDRDQALVQLRI
jgi:hypothetical protein